MIHCIGNSHVWLFNGEPNNKFSTHDQSSPYFKVKWLGPTLAYNFREHHLPMAVEYLKSNAKSGDQVMLVVGEVDCRWHLPFQMDKQKKHRLDIVAECADRYFSCFIDLLNLGYKPIVWGTHPTTTHGHVNPPGDNTYGPIFGDVKTRNEICLTWNLFLKGLCRDNGIPFVTIYHHLVDENNLTKMEYFRDYCHLNNDMCVPLVIEEMKLKGLL